MLINKSQVKKTSWFQWIIDLLTPIKCPYYKEIKNTKSNKVVIRVCKWVAESGYICPDWDLAQPVCYFKEKNGEKGLVEGFREEYF
jgi:hypothetical protein